MANWHSRFAKETGKAGLSFAHTKQIQLGRTGCAGSPCVLRPGFVGIWVLQIMVSQVVILSNRGFAKSRFYAWRINYTAYGFPAAVKSAKLSVWHTKNVKPACAEAWQVYPAVLAGRVPGKQQEASGA